MHLIPLGKSSQPVVVLIAIVLHFGNIHLQDDLDTTSIEKRQYLGKFDQTTTLVMNAFSEDTRPSQRSTARSTF